MTAVVGEALVDVVHRPDGSGGVHAGGSPANVAVGLARLGNDVTLIARFGRDEYGELLARHFADNRVRVAEGTVTREPTSVAEAFLDESGAARYEFRLRWDLGAGPPELPGGTRHVHTGSIAAVTEPGAAVVARLVGSARVSTTVSYDPNCRPSLMGAPDEARPRIEALVAGSDVVKVSDEDLGWLYPGTDPADLARRWLALGPALVVVTRGADGSVGWTATGHEVTSPAPATAVVDTVGAGDAFMAGLLDILGKHELLGADRRHRLRGVDPDTLRAVLEHAGLVAAMTVARPGAD
ncbi:MAG: carbohydrate kinase, partial [Actinomycetota bacterium]|nr:carbohydrate kinase [Actinomycetota bacterium]